MNNKHAPYTLDEMSSAIDLLKRQQSPDLPDKKKFQLAHILSAIGFRRGHAQTDLSDVQIKMHLTRMMNGSRLNTWKLSLPSFRVRKAINGDLQTDLSGLVARKPPHDAYGRCHTKESSVYYAALDIQTALLECEAEEGSLYQVLEISPNGETQLETVIVGWLDYFRRHKAPPPLLTALRDSQVEAVMELIANTTPEDATKQILFDAFIADQFRKNVRDDKNEEYRATALYSSLALETDGFEQILYPSVANFGGWNVAIRPDLVTERFEISSVHLI